MGTFYCCDEGVYLLLRLLPSVVWWDVAYQLEADGLPLRVSYGNACCMFEEELWEELAEGCMVKVASDEDVGAIPQSESPYAKIDRIVVYPRTLRVCRSASQVSLSTTRCGLCSVVRITSASLFG